MRCKLLLLALFLLCASSVSAQFQTSHAPIRSGPNDPATCSTTASAYSKLFYNTTSNVWKYCSATDTWTALQGGSGCTVSGANNGVVTDDGASGCVTETNLTFDGSTLAATGSVTASTGFGSALGTITTDVKALNVTGTFNNAAIAFKPLFANFTNTASHSGARIFELQVGSTSQIDVTAAGVVTVAGGFRNSTSSAVSGAFRGANNADTVCVRNAGNSADICIKLDGSDDWDFDGVPLVNFTAAFSTITAGTNTTALVIGTGGSLGVSGSGTISATDSAAVDGRSVTITSAAAEDVLVDNGSGYVNAQLGLTSRADNDGTVALATTDRNDVVNVGHATANAVSIAEAGAAAGNGFIAGWKTTVCTTGAGLTTITPTTSTINGYATLTLRQHECAVIRVPTEADTNYLAQIDGGQFIEVNIELFGPGTATATGDGKAYFLISEKLNGTTLIGMRSQVYTAGTTNTTDIGLDRCAAAATGNVCSGTVADMLSVVQTIDTGENSSDTAATGVTINASNAQVSTSQVLRFNVDAISTTPAQGLQVTLRFRK